MTILGRVVRDKWTDEEAILTPPGRPRRTTRWLTLDGVTLSLTEWARKLGTTKSAISSRLQSGMSEVEALSTPMGALNPRRDMRRNRMITYNGETLCLVDWADRLGITSSTLHHRLRVWGIERALTEPKRL